LQQEICTPANELAASSVFPNLDPDLVFNFTEEVLFDPLETSPFFAHDPHALPPDPQHLISSLTASQEPKREENLWTAESKIESPSGIAFRALTRAVSETPLAASKLLQQPLVPNDTKESKSSASSSSSSPLTSSPSLGLGDTKEMERQRQRMQNRKYARASRQRKKEYIQNMEKRNLMLEQHITQMHWIILGLQTENQDLKKQLQLLKEKVSHCGTCTSSNSVS
jgi:hypothetical protein